MKTAFIGLGAMGAPMARNLHAAGLLAAVQSRPTAALQGRRGAGLGIDITHCMCMRVLSRVRARA